MRQDSKKEHANAEDDMNVMKVKEPEEAMEVDKRKWEAECKLIRTVQIR